MNTNSSTAVYGAVAEAVPAGAQVGGGNGNRWVYADGATVVDTVAFGGMADIGKHGVLLQVNMATQTISPLGVHVAGSFQDPAWDPSATMMHNPDGSNMYKHLFQVMPGTSIEFKYVNGDVWGDDETVPPGCAKSAQIKIDFSTTSRAIPFILKYAMVLAINVRAPW